MKGIPDMTIEEAQAFSKVFIYFWLVSNAHFPADEKLKNEFDKCLNYLKKAVGSDIQNCLPNEEATNA